MSDQSNSSAVADRHQAILKNSDLGLDDDTTKKLTDLWGQIETFIVTDLGDGFQLRDIYSLIAALMNGLEITFTAVTGHKLKAYATFLVEQIIIELTARGIIPSEAAVLLRLVPVGTVIDLLSHISKHPPFINRLGAGQNSHQSDWVRRNWVAADRNTKCGNTQYSGKDSEAKYIQDS